MRVLWMLVVLMCLSTGAVLAQDPVVADPAHYSVVFENDQVRVLRIRYGPNEQGVMHSHPAGVAVYLDDISGEFTLADGQVVNAQGKAREAVWMEARASTVLIASSPSTMPLDPLRRCCTTSAKTCA